MPDTWSMAGQYFEACNCDVACPCIFGSDPTPGVCTFLGGFHIDRGAAGTLRLDELNFAMALFCPGNMATNKWEVAYYLDGRATDPQRQALEAILTGKAGGIFSGWASVFGTFHGVRLVPIEFHLDGKKRSLSITGVAELRVEALSRGDGKETTITPGPFTPEVTVAKSEKFRLSDKEWKWDISGKNSFFAPFTAQGP